MDKKVEFEVTRFVSFNSFTTYSTWFFQRERKKNIITGKMENIYLILFFWSGGNIIYNKNK